MTPMNTNSGTATRISLIMALPYTRFGKMPRNAKSNTPSSALMPANSSATPASVKATGKPAIRKPHTLTNMKQTRYSLTRHTPGPRSSAAASGRAFEAAHDEQRMHEHGKPLQRQHERKDEKQRFQQPERHEGAFGRAFQHAHGGADIGEALPGHDGAERPQEDEHAG